MDDEELFLCQTTLTDLKWIEKSLLSLEQYENFVKKDINTCNTVKTKVYSCESKCKTRGVLLGATNCGLVISFSELYGSES